MGRRAAFIPENSLANAYSEEVRAWLPDATEMKLVARHEGRDNGMSVNAFVKAAKGLAKTLTFVETENGGSICGGYLDVEWVDGGYAKDPDRRSFIFTLKNHLGVPPTRFGQKRDEDAALRAQRHGFYFGLNEGFDVVSYAAGLRSGGGYDAPDQGVFLFHGDDNGAFCVARWELWEVE
jgi:hypothetical protein